MANAHDIEAVFLLLYPDIDVAYANETTIDEAAMAAIPQWQGVRALFLTIENKIIHGLRTTYPPAHPFNENFVMQVLVDTPAITP